MAFEALREEGAASREDQAEARLPAAASTVPRRSLGLQLVGLVIFCAYGVFRLPRLAALTLRSKALSQWVSAAAYRVAGHIVLLALGIAALWATPLVAGQISGRALLDEPERYSTLPAFRVSTAEAVFPDVIERPILLETRVILRPRDEIFAYEVRGNDTLVDIADRFRIELDTLLWANDIAPDHLLVLGYKLRIPPIDGVIHVVAGGDLLHEIAEKYQSNPVAIAEYNRIGLSTTLVAGMELIIPNGILPEALRKSRGDTQLAQREQPVAAFGEFRWPAQGVITQYYHSRHLALDIGNRTGTAIVAADAGRISAAGWSALGYGYRIVIDHGNGWVSTYSHLSTFAVSVGDFVRAGEYIGAMGSTGYSTGPHLHFEVLYHNRFQNPLPLLN
ncbi:MAG: peptidoglycan DD-metalloendopeptidase family protein [Chloroflexi bacterium]|nr:peptidoglycan DD-metalloendopeptidase family protein [Chloroflexota bacterium]